MIISVSLSFDLSGSCILFWLPSCFEDYFFLFVCFLFCFALFFLVFLMLWILVNVNKAKTLNKILALVWIFVTVCKIEFTLWKTLITFTCSFTCPPLPFSLKHMLWHVFTHEISNWNKYFSPNVSLKHLN